MIRERRFPSTEVSNAQEKPIEMELSAQTVQKGFRQSHRIIHAVLVSSAPICAIKHSQH